jgi:hypothetical protein
MLLPLTGTNGFTIACRRRTGQDFRLSWRLNAALFVIRRLWPLCEGSRRRLEIIFNPRFRCDGWRRPLHWHHRPAVLALSKTP